MVEIVAFPKQAAAPNRSSWAAFEPAIRHVLEIAGCHVQMIDWIIADVARRWPRMFPDLPPALIEIDTTKVGALKDFINALGNAHITSVILLEIELYQALHPAPNGGVRVTRAG